MNQREDRYPVSGMRCATCSSTIEEALERIEGVLQADANYATGEVHVAYDEDAVRASRLVEAIEEAGYSVPTRSKTLTVSGMRCATCSNTVQQALEGVPDVVSAEVNYATDEAHVDLLDPVEDLEPAYEAIEEAGYEPSRPVEDEDALEAREEATDRELARQRRLVVGGGILTAPFLLVMLDMVWPVLPEAVAGISLGWVEFLLATALMATLGLEFFRGAWSALVTSGRANMDSLVALGTSAGYAYSTVVLLGALQGGLYFEAVAVILWFITLGNYLEARSKAKASSALQELLELQADEATVVRDGEEVQVPLEEIQVGDVLKVRPGERVPTDGAVVEGQSAVDESMVTGESLPVDKQPGDEVIGSTINENGVLFVEATRVGEDTAIQQIVERVKRAQARQPPIQRLVDRVSGVFVPLVIVNAIAWAGLWYAFPGALSSFVTQLPLWGLAGGGPLVGGVPVVEFSMIVLASALLIACPCALGLATPAATMVGSTLSARNGILFKGADVLEQVRGVDTVVFDKTGTLTTGQMSLTDVRPVGGLDEGEVLSLAASAESASEHPLARAIVEAAKDQSVPLQDPDAFENVPGRGILATVDGRRVLVGNRGFAQEEGVDASGAGSVLEELESAGRTAMLVAVEGDLVGVVAAADRVRASARETVSALQRRGLEVVMLTGDNERTAHAVASELGIPGSNVRAGILPGDKADAVEALQEGGRRVLMVGDGVNDAPALTAADVGVAIGSGTDVAIESGDITLMRDDPGDVLKALRIGEATISKVRQNLFWAFAYNVTLVPIASLGLLNPALAGIAMAGSSVSVMANSLSFARYSPEEEYQVAPLRWFQREKAHAAPQGG